MAAIACAPGISHISPAQETPPLYPVSGVVLNTLTRQPIPRVLVDGGADAVLTDGDGRFEINLPEGIGQIQVRRPGYNSRGLEIAHAVNVGPKLPALIFYLTPQASITGHVTLSSGDDPDGIRFSVYIRHAVKGHLKWRMAGGASTNTEGVFRIANLETPGVYVICSLPVQDRTAVSDPDSPDSPESSTRSIARSSARSRGYPSVCYPGPISESVDAANLLPISPGQQIDFELSLNRQPFYPVSIAVPNAAPGQPVGAQIFDSSGRAQEYPISWNRQLGVAKVNLPNGQYYAEAQAGGEIAYFGRVDFHVSNAPVSGLSTSLLPLRPIPVEIHREFLANTRNAPSQPENGISFNSSGDQYDPGVNLVLTPTDSGMGNSIGSGVTHRQGTTDKSLFELNNVTPGRYWVESTAYQGYISSITSGGADLTREPFIVGPGNSTAPLQIVLRNDGGEIHCDVNAMQSQAAASAPGEMSFVFVYAISESSNRSQLSQSVSQGPGTVVLNNLAPGRYRVLAIDKYLEAESADPAEISRLSALGKPVTVEAGGTTNVELDLIKTSGAEAHGQEGTTP
jgi:hypothetical protein